MNEKFTNKIKERNIYSEIIIRPGKLGDEKGIYNLMKIGLKRKNWTYTGTNKADPKKIEKMRTGFLSKTKDSYSLLAVEKSTGIIVGSLSIHAKHKGRLSHRVDFGWGTHPDFQGKGIGTRLLREGLKFAKKKGFKKAQAEIACENYASLRIAEKCGFEIEGTLKKGMKTDDRRYIDTHIVGKVL